LIRNLVNITHLSIIGISINDIFSISQLNNLTMLEMDYNENLDYISLSIMPKLLEVILVGIIPDQIFDYLYNLFNDNNKFLDNYLSN
jgi:hypothetical protein